MPLKQVDKLVQLLDRLLQEPRGAQVLALTMTYLLGEWLRDGEDVLNPPPHRALTGLNW